MNQNDPRPAYLPLVAMFLGAIGGSLIWLFGIEPLLSGAW